LSVVPGAAHIDLGRALRGVLFFFLFAFWVNVALVAPLVLGLREARTWGGVLAGVIWLAALLDAGRLAARRASAPAQKPPETPAAPDAAKKDAVKPVP